MASSLRVQDTIYVHTDTGRREIQLCFGDITELPLAQKVDLIMVSAFPGDYSAVRGTLIGALFNKFGLSVRNLAANKAEDLRRHFHCWLSHELPDNLPYRRLLCFEQSLANVSDYGKSKSDLVGEIFRALCTTFSEQDRSVIAPLLATGNQMLSRRRMLRAMVTSCASWMRAGLPMSKLILVIYQRDPRGRLGPDDQAAVDEFSKLKRKLEKEVIDKLPHMVYDLYTAWSSLDSDLASRFMTALQDLRPSLRVLTKVVDQLEGNRARADSEEEGSEPLWQDEVQKDMLQSNRVVTFLSPQFMECGRGVEEYNLALCLSHKARRQLLAPVYLKTISDLPTYMALTQWIDCRKKEHDTPGIDKLKLGVDLMNKILSDHMNEKQKKITSSSTTSTGTVTSSTQTSYDIFISYSHRDSKAANTFLQAIKETMPQWKIFFDRDEIKTGYSWQATLFNSLSNTRIILALISPSYISSTVCREEFSLALSQHLTKEYDTRLIPLMLNSKTIGSRCPTFMSHLPLLYPHFDEVNNPDDPDSQSWDDPSLLKLGAYASHVAQRLLKEDDELGVEHMNSFDMNETLACARGRFFKKIFNVKEDGTLNIKDIFIEASKDTKPSPEADSATQLPTHFFPQHLAEHRRVVVSFHEDNHLAAKTLDTLLQYYSRNTSGLKVDLISSTVSPKAGMEAMDAGSVLVCLLSSSYVTWPSCMLQLQVAVSRHRQGCATLCPVILRTLPSRPSFLRLIPTRFAESDPHITDIVKMRNNTHNVHQDIHKLRRDRIHESRSDRSSLPDNVVLLMEAVAMWIIHCGFKEAFSEDKCPVICSLPDLQSAGFGSPQATTLITENTVAMDIPTSCLDDSLRLRSPSAPPLQVSVHPRSGSDHASGGPSVVSIRASDIAPPPSAHQIISQPMPYEANQDTPISHHQTGGPVHRASRETSPTMEAREHLPENLLDDIKTKKSQEPSDVPTVLPTTPTQTKPSSEDKDVEVSDSLKQTEVNITSTESDSLKQTEVNTTSTENDSSLKSSTCHIL